MEQQTVIGSEMAVPVRRPFDPVAFDLDANFRLTRFSDLKGLGCKVPRDGLNKMLEPLKEQERSQLEAEQMHFQYVIPAPRIGWLIQRVAFISGFVIVLFGSSQYHNYATLMRSLMLILMHMLVVHWCQFWLAKLLNTLHSVFR